MSNTTSMELSGEGSVESTTTNSTAVQSTLWVFGYGSLIWKTGFPYTRTLIGHIKGYVVRFWQACTYYRGTPEAPGRVATLVKNDEGITWGMAFEVDPNNVSDVIDYLNEREIGYTKHELCFYPKNSNTKTLKVLVYIAMSEDNPSYVGPESVDEVVQRVVTSKGRSGANTEYVLELAKALRKMEVVDKHVFEIADKIEQLASQHNHINH